MLSWIGLGVALGSARMQRHVPGAPATATRDLQSWGGLALQGAGFALAWGKHPQPDAAWWPGMDATGQSALLVFAAVLALASSAFAVVAVRELGKQWSLTARLLSSHELVTSGPFARVRHPIYSALLGLLVATGLCLGTALATGAGTLVYLIGTHWRAAREEKLLLSRFGDPYLEYARRVPRLIPGRRRA
jgi:protein-S-isoprenylcysteine O-methyltransferase Ste14